MSEKKINVKLKQKRQALGRGLKSLLDPNFKESKIEGLQFLEEEKKEDFYLKTPLGQKEKTHPNEEDHSSLISYSTHSKEFVQVKIVGIEQLRPNTNQPRRAFEEKSLNELAQSIKQKGILQPILVRRTQGERGESSTHQESEKNKTPALKKASTPFPQKPSKSKQRSTLRIEMFEIIAGERRWKAAQKAGLHEVPVILKEASDQKSLELALVENIQRKNLNSLEEAKAYTHLLKTYSLTQDKLAQYLGKDKATIKNILRLLNLSSKAKEALSADKISLGIAKVLLALKDENEQNTLLDHVIKKGLTVREVTEQVHFFHRKGFFKFQYNKEKKQVLPEEKDVFLKKLSEDLQQTLGTRVHIHHLRGKGKISLYFYSNEELNDLVERLIKHRLTR